MVDTSKPMPERKDVPEKYTWKLEDIFATDELWEEELASLTEDIPKIKDFQGTLASSAKNIYEVLQLQDEISERFTKLYTYARMRADQDTANSTYQTMQGKGDNVLTLASSSMSFIVPEIIQIDEDKLDEMIESYEPLQFYRQTFDQINLAREHVLSEKEEALLAEASDPLQTAAQTFNILDNAEMVFPSIKDEKGEEAEVTHGRFIGFLESKDRRVRKDAFESVYSTYDKFKNTYATTLTGNVKKNNFNAKVRNHSSARAAALHGNNIPESVYDELIEAIHEKLPLLHRYVKLRKKVLGVDELHMYDMYTPLVKDVDMKFTYEEAQEHVLESLAPLGQEYVDIVKEGLSSRWIDVMENKGKRSGAYSSGAYGTNPYILLNWNNKIGDVFTLTHELGHSLHSYYTHESQAFRYGNYSIFVAEVASTCNEALLNDHMLHVVDDKQEKIYLLNNFLEGFRGTVFRQTMFAEFEHDIHIRMQNGEALNAERLTELYYELNKKYFGDDVVIDEEIGLEWARIPHFYMNYYVYQYATGYSAATTLAQGILDGKEGAVERYKSFLKAGSSDYPIEVLKKAGVDVTSKQPVLDALDVFEEKLTELEQLLGV